jgi:hypothetical protein
MKKISGEELVKLLESFCVKRADPQGYVGHIERDDLIQYAKDLGLDGRVSTDSIGSAKKHLIALGRVKDVDYVWELTPHMSLANKTALDVVLAGGTMKDALGAKRALAKQDNIHIEELFESLALREHYWLLEDKKELGRSSPTEKTEEGREAWTRDAAMRYLGNACMISGDPVYVNGKDNGVDAAHVLPLELLQRWGFRPLNSPHVIRLLRADIHRRDDSGVAPVKDNPLLKTPDRFKDSHAKAEELKRLLGLMETKGTTR